MSHLSAPARWVLGLWLLLAGCSGEGPAADAPGAPEPDFLARAPIPPPEQEVGAGDEGANPWLRGFPTSGEEPEPSGSAAEPTDEPRADPSDDPTVEPLPVEPANLLITQYYEGTGNNKALELTNLGAQPLDLSRCRLVTYVNGSTTPYRNAALSGTLAGGASVVVCSASTTAPLSAYCDTTSSAIAYNGNDAVLLRCDDALLDSFGRLGEDPGAAWGTAVRTIDANLIRSCSVAEGDRTPDDVFEPEAEWRSVPLTELDDLGRWSCPEEPSEVEEPLPDGFEPLPEAQGMLCAGELLEVP